VRHSQSGLPSIAYLIVIAALTCMPSKAQAQGPFTHDFFAGNHQLDSAAPNEHVDPLSGNLLVTATDLVLPGNAGLNLAVTRIYSSQIFPDYESSGSTAYEDDNWAGLGWRLHWGRLIHLEGLGDGGTPPTTVVELPGGGGGLLHWIPQYMNAPFPEKFVTGHFARYDKDTKELRLPGGLVYTFNHMASSPRGGSMRYVTKIEDPHGNRIEFTYFSGSGVPYDAVQEIRQYVGEASPRVITFTYDATLKSLATMTYAGRTWTYNQTSVDGTRSRLNSVVTPTGATTTYTYGSGTYKEMTGITTPSGGTVSYTYQGITRPINGTTKQARVVATRVTGGYQVTAGTWTFTYSTGTDNAWTYVVSPCNRTEYRYIGIGTNGPFRPWIAGAMEERRTEALDGTLLEREQLTWIQSAMISPDDIPASGGLSSDPDVYKPLLQQRVITRGSQTWTTTYEYASSDFNDYLQPWKIEEDGQNERTRETTRVFAHDYTPHFPGRVGSQTVTEGGASTTTSRTFNASTGFVTSITARGVTTTFAPTSHGNVASITDAANKTTTFTYSWGVQKNVVTPELTTTRVINADGSTRSVEVGSGAGSYFTQYDYHANGRLEQVYPPGVYPYGSPPGTLQYEYAIDFRWVRVTQYDTDTAKYTQRRTDIDGFGRVWQVSDSFGVKVRTAYDACGRPTFVSEPHTSGTEIGTTTTYDALGRPTTVRAPGVAVGGPATQYSYSGNNVTITDAAGKATTYNYHAAGHPDAGWLTSVTDAAANTTSYTYDLFGQLKTVSMPNVPTRTWNYNSHGRLTSDVQPESGTTSYTYDAVGNVATMTNALGQVTTFTYDNNHRLKTRQRTGDASANLTLHYNAGGDVWKSEIPGVMTTEYEFELSSWGSTTGRIAKRKDTRGTLTWQSLYTYDKLGNQLTVMYPSGRVVTTTYGREGRVLGVAHGGGTLASNFVYGDTGALTSFQTGTVTQSVTLDARNRLRTIGVGSLLNLTYDYDNVNNITAITDPRLGRSSTYAYDNLHRLASASMGGIQQGWTFDSAGNRLAETGTTPRTFTYDTATERLTSMAGGGATETFSYNALGQLTGDSRGIYAYTPTGRLAGVTGPSGLAASYAYDPDDMRLARTVNGQTTYTIRGAGGAILSEYQSACAAGLVWSRDLLYAGGRLIGAAKSTTAIPVVEVSTTASTVSEAATSASIGVRLASGGPLPCAVTVAWETRPGTATPGADYTTAAGTVMFPAGTTNGAVQNVGVTLLPDTLDEDNETVIVALANPVGAIVGAASAHTVTITDDDPTPTLTVTDLTIAEPESGSINAVITATLSNGSGRTVTANYATADGTATAGSDYTATSGALTFLPGELTKVIAIPILADTAIEPDETLTVALSGVQYATPPASPATVTIPANDHLTVTLTADRSFPVAAGTAVTFTAGTTGGTPPYEFQFFITQHGTAQRVVRLYSTTQTFVWTPATADAYTVHVWARSVGSGVPYEGFAELGAFWITAAPAVTLTSLTPNTAYTVGAGTTVTWTAAGSGGVAPLQYRFSTQLNGGAWTTVRDWGPAASAPWVVPQQGSFLVRAEARRAGSNGAAEATLTSSTFTGTTSAPSIPLFTADRPLPVPPNTTVTWTAQAGGTGPLEYAFWTKLGSGSFVLAQAYSLSPTFPWTPTTSGTYTVDVGVRPVGSTAGWLARKSVTNVVVGTGAIGSVGLTASQSVPVTVGTPITWTASATGGAAPLLYQFWLYDATLGTWTMLRDWSAARTWTWTPAPASYGTHMVAVWIKATGSPNAYDTAAWSGYFTVTP
jgi:YD repeat-containing protein